MERRSELQQTIAMDPEPSAPFTELPPNEWRTVFFGLTDDVKEHLVADMSRSDLETFIGRLDPDEVTDVLGYTDEDTRGALLETLDAERREKIDFLLSFDPETAAGVMSLNYVTVDETKEFPGVIERVRRFEDRT